MKPQQRNDDEEFLDNGDGEITLSERQGFWSRAGRILGIPEKEVVDWLIMSRSKLSQETVDQSIRSFSEIGKMCSWPKVGLSCSKKIGFVKNLVWQWSG